jgi:chromosome segregation ATPase
MSVANNAMKEISAHLRAFRWFVELEDQVREAGSLEALIAQRRQELADIDATIATTLQAADEESARRIATAEDEARAAVNAAKGQLTVVEDQITDAQARRDRLDSEIASLVGKFTR